MKKLFLIVASLLGFSLATASAESSLGIGVRGFHSVDSVPNRFQKTGLGATLSLRTELNDLMAAQFELDHYDDGYAGASKDVLAPQAFLLVGGELYAGAGVGILYSSKDFADKPFFVLRIGYLAPISDRLSLDINASYEFSEWKRINEFDPTVSSDTVVLSAAFRIGF